MSEHKEIRQQGEHYSDFSRPRLVACPAILILFINHCFTGHFLNTSHLMKFWVVQTMPGSAFGGDFPFMIGNISRHLHNCGHTDLFFPLGVIAPGGWGGSEKLSTSRWGTGTSSLGRKWQKRFSQTTGMAAGWNPVLGSGCFLPEHLFSCGRRGKWFCAPYVDVFLWRHLCCWY